jgi:hypothetical protein
LIEKDEIPIVTDPIRKSAMFPLPTNHSSSNNHSIRAINNTTHISTKPSQVRLSDSFIAQQLEANKGHLSSNPMVFENRLSSEKEKNKHKKTKEVER